MGKSEKVVHIQYGRTVTYLLEGAEGSALVDTDWAGALDSFFKALKTQVLAVEDIGYVLCAHWHPDHRASSATLNASALSLSPSMCSCPIPTRLTRSLQLMQSIASLLWRIRTSRSCRSLRAVRSLPLWASPERPSLRRAILWTASLFCLIPGPSSSVTSQRPIWWQPMEKAHQSSFLLTGSLCVPAIPIAPALRMQESLLAEVRFSC